jgi:hypothetical protein
VQLDLQRLLGPCGCVEAGGFSSDRISYIRGDAPARFEVGFRASLKAGVEAHESPGWTLLAGRRRYTAARDAEHLSLDHDDRRATPP